MTPSHSLIASVIHCAGLKVIEYMDRYTSPIEFSIQIREITVLVSKAKQTLGLILDEKNALWLVVENLILGFKFYVLLILSSHYCSSLWSPHST